MTGHELAAVLERTAAFVRDHEKVDGLDMRLAGGVRVIVPSTGAQRVRRHRAQSKHPDDPLQHGVTGSVTPAVTEALHEAVTPVEFRPPPHPLPSHSKLNNPESFPDSESLLPGSSDLDLTGDARVAESVTRQRVAGRVRRPRQAKWTRVPSDWEPRDEERQLARDEGVTFERELADFRDHEFKTPRADADATFRKWLRRAGDMRRAYGRPPGAVEHEARQAPAHVPFKREATQQPMPLGDVLAAAQRAKMAVRSGR